MSNQNFESFDADRFTPVNNARTSLVGLLLGEGRNAFTHKQA